MTAADHANTRYGHDPSRCKCGCGDQATTSEGMPPAAADHANTSSEGRGNREHLSSAEAAAPPGPETHAADHANTVELPISGGGVTLIDAADLPLVEGLRLHCDRSDNGYVYFTLRRYGHRPKHQSLARLLMDAPDGMEVDHINGVRLDNRRANLRVVTQSVNQRNRHRLNKNNTSGYPGVARSTHGTWRAYIRVDRRLIHLGYFDNPEDAYEARLAAEDTYFGDQA